MISKNKTITTLIVTEINEMIFLNFKALNISPQPLAGRLSAYRENQY
jgi:hypothetical protein